MRSVPVRSWWRVSSFTDDPRARTLPRVADFTSVDAERIVALRPDVAIGITSQARLVDPLRRAGIDVVLLHDDAFADIFTNLHAIGALANRRNEAAAVIAQLQRTTMQLHARTRTFRAQTVRIRRARQRRRFGRPARPRTSRRSSLWPAAGTPQPTCTRHTASTAPKRCCARSPMCMVTDPAIRLDAAIDGEPWRSLRAVHRHHVYTVDPAAIIERPGPQYNEGIRWLIERLTPLAK